MNDPKSADQIAAAVQVFQKDVGEWDVDLTVTPGPGAPPVQSKGTSSNRLVAGKWLVIDHQTESGFEGHGVYGFDPALGKYTGIWVDSMGTAIARSEGAWDAATRTMTYVSRAHHAGRDFEYKEITQTQPDGTLLYRNILVAPDGGEFEMIRAVHRRRGN